jgi:cytochrome c oxidase cbb3-type subunit 2
MKNGFVFYLGLFGAMALSWGGIMLANLQLGTLAPHFDENEGKAFPERVSGIAARGQYVYADLGCASCHTQQVRRPDFGTDQVRGWGERQSFARDYIHQTRVQLGESRVGPDLANLGSRKPPYDAEDLMKLLYAGTELHPAYKFLFEERAIVGQRSLAALNLGSKFPVAPGREIVPTERAQTLVAYLLSLNNSYEYPAETAANTVKAAAKEGEHKGEPAKEPARPGEEKNAAVPAPGKEINHK